MLTIDTKDTAVPILHQYLLGAVAPRPIAFVSTIDAQGRPNLAPYSFFNIFSVKPPIAIFSPARRGKDNTTKHTYENALVVKECVINIVSHSMVQQMSVASAEFPQGVSEFDKSGFTPLASDLVKPFRVAESPVQMECKINDVIALGAEGGAGNLVVCEILRFTHQ
jgi:flavin reductase (DIM6/NTAB) family NADH-FMN oxidoreductase RutF